MTPSPEGRQEAAVLDRLYDDKVPMADGEIRMTAAEDVLGWLLIEKIGVPDDRNYTPKEAQDIIAASIDHLREYENAALIPAKPAVEVVEALKVAREEIVIAIAFLGRDAGTSRIDRTIESLINRLVKADQLAQAALSQNEVDRK